MSGQKGAEISLKLGNSSVQPLSSASEDLISSVQRGSNFTGDAANSLNWLHFFWAFFDAV